jgi:hypothetical protein
MPIRSNLPLLSWMQNEIRIKNINNVECYNLECAWFFATYGYSFLVSYWLAYTACCGKLALYILNMHRQAPMHILVYDGCGWICYLLSASWRRLGSLLYKLMIWQVNLPSTTYLDHEGAQFLAKCLHDKKCSSQNTHLDLSCPYLWYCRSGKFEWIQH